MPTPLISPNMSLIVPVPGQSTGPDWAQNLYIDLFQILDQHDHSSGKGVQITPSGLNINTALPFNNNDLTSVGSLIFGTTPASPSNGSIYESGVDLYYKDGAGNAIRITSGGSVNAGAGSITGLTSPATATYISGTPAFVFQSDTNTAADIDGGSFILRRIAANSKGITLAPPSGLAADYTLSLPSAPPSAQSIMAMDSSGNVTAPYTVDNSTLDISANKLEVKAGGITATQIANSTITGSQIASSVALAGVPVRSGIGPFATGPNTAFGPYIQWEYITSTSTVFGGGGSITVASAWSGTSPASITLNFVNPSTKQPVINLTGINNFGFYVSSLTSTSVTVTASGGRSDFCIMIMLQA